MATCPACKGSGIGWADEIATDECEQCHGDGLLAPGRSEIAARLIVGQCVNCGHDDHHGERCDGLADDEFCACSWPDPSNFTGDEQPRLRISHVTWRTSENPAPPMDSGARMSIDGMYRWLLWRRWDEKLPTMTLVMLNPSTADHRTDDPTIRRCLGFARREGCGELVVVNLFAYRTPDPKDLAAAIKAGVDPWGERQANTMYWALSNAHRPHVLVAAWGAHKVAEMAMDKVPERLPWLCLGTTKDGHPRHPLYVKGDQPLVPWAKP